MKNVKTAYTTRTVGEAQGYLPLHIMDAAENGNNHMVTFWKPTAEELKFLNDGHFINLTIPGIMHPPIAVEVLPMKITEVTEKVS